MSDIRRSGSCPRGKNLYKLGHKVEPGTSSDTAGVKDVAPHKEHTLTKHVVCHADEAREVVCNPGHGKHPTNVNGGGAIDDYEVATEEIGTFRSDTTNHDLNLDKGPCDYRYM